MRAECWSEEAVVGVENGQDVEIAMIARHESNVAKGVVLAATCAAKESNFEWSVGT